MPASHCPGKNHLRVSCFRPQDIWTPGWRGYLSCQEVTALPGLMQRGIFFTTQVVHWQPQPDWFLPDSQFPSIGSILTIQLNSLKKMQIQYNCRNP